MSNPEDSVAEQAPVVADGDALTEDIVNERIQGTVKWFNVKSGYGFIQRDDNSEDVFVHRTSIIKNNPAKYVRSVGDGEKVEFYVGQGEKGPEARDVTGPDGTAVKGSKYAPSIYRRRNRYNYRRYGNRRPRNPERTDNEGDQERRDDDNPPRRNRRRFYRRSRRPPPQQQQEQQQEQQQQPPANQMDESGADRSGNENQQDSMNEQREERDRRPPRPQRKRFRRSRGPRRPRSDGPRSDGRQNDGPQSDGGQDGQQDGQQYGQQDGQQYGQQDGQQYGQQDGQQYGQRDGEQNGPRDVERTVKDSDDARDQDLKEERREDAPRPRRRRRGPNRYRRRRRPDQQEGEQRQKEQPEECAPPMENGPPEESPESMTA